MFGRAALLMLAAALFGAVAGETHSRFSSTAANGGNVFQAAGSFCAAGPRTEVASADSYVDAALGSQGSNFGTATRLDVRSELAASRRALVRFALPAVPPNCSVTSATLRLHANASSSGRTLEAFRAASSWTETGVTWGDQPAVTGSAATTTSGSGWREWTVTAHVQAMYGGSNHGFLVRDSSETAVLASTQAFSSREGSRPPELVVTFG